MEDTLSKIVIVHQVAFYQCPFRWIYKCHSSKSAGKETGKTNLCAVEASEDVIDRKIVFKEKE